MIVRGLMSGYLGRYLRKRKGFILIDIFVGIGVGLLVMLAVGIYHNSQMKMFNKRMDAFDMDSDMQVAFAFINKKLQTAIDITTIGLDGGSVDIKYLDNASATKVMRFFVKSGNLVYLEEATSDISHSVLVLNNVVACSFSKLTDAKTGRQSLKVYLKAQDAKGNTVERAGLFRIPYSGAFF